MKQGTMVLGILAGITAGALLGILFAPHKGSKTRKMILNKGEELSNDLQDKYEDFVDSMTDKFNDTKHEVEVLVSKGKSVMEETNNMVKKATV